MKSFTLAALLVVGSGAMNVAAAVDENLSADLSKLQAVGPKGTGHLQATAAAKNLARADAEALPQILAAMDGTGPVATNWIRGVAESVAQRAVDAGKKLPVAELEKFLAETNHSPRARRLAFELIGTVDATAPQRLIPTLLNDPSTELRREAVVHALDEAAKLTEKPGQIAEYRKAFQASRDLDQIKAAAAKLEELQETVDIPTHMGFLMTWKLIGPFDNVADKGWDVAYPPEAGTDLTANYEGQKGLVKWLEHTTADKFGVVDLNKALTKHKGAIAYATTEFFSDRQRPAELRFGSINANKLWLNGKLLTTNHVYHAGIEVDQYLAQGELKPGKNTILLKICQNEQTEMWAQDWNFQLRVCDSIGTAILSQDRPAKLAALIPALR